MYPWEGSEILVTRIQVYIGDILVYPIQGYIGISWDTGIPPRVAHIPIDTVPPTGTCTLGVNTWGGHTYTPG